MKRNAALKILNPILGLLLVCQLATGFFHEALPHELFEVVHEGVAIALAVAALLHLSLNWNWVRANYQHKG
jgi:hypothetical protein